MCGLTIRRGTSEDIKVLAKMNKQLIEDEKHDNPMNIEQLESRMSSFINGEYNAFFFYNKEQIIGYALVNMVNKPLYLRQFFIVREVREQGYGKRFFSLLMKTLNVTEIDLEVLERNESGKAFWKSLGFQTRSLYMRLILGDNE